MSGISMGGESLANKSISVLADKDSDIKYPSVKAIADYVDLIAADVSQYPSCRVATRAALPSCSYNNGTDGVGATLQATGNGALTIDSILMVTNDRSLINNQANKAHNGYYIVTDTGDNDNPWILTRADDFDEPSDITPDFTIITEGNTNSGKIFMLASVGPYTIGTTPIEFTRLAGEINYTFISPLQVSGTDVSLTYTPENVANKSTSLVTDAASDVKYPSVKSVKTYVDSILPITVASGNQLNQTGHVVIASKVSPVAGSYEIGGYINVSSYTLGAVTLVVAYRDAGGVSRELTVPLVSLAGVVAASGAALAPFTAMVTGIQTDGSGTISVCVNPVTFTGTYSAWVWIKWVA